jgi:hypothetical protein
LKLGEEIFIKLNKKPKLLENWGRSTPKNCQVPRPKDSVNDNLFRWIYINNIKIIYSVHFESIFSWNYWFKIHTVNNFKIVNAQQANVAYNYKNAKQKLPKTNSEIRSKVTVMSCIVSAFSWHIKWKYG